MGFRRHPYVYQGPAVQRRQKAYVEAKEDYDRTQRLHSSDFMVGYGVPTSESVPTEPKINDFTETEPAEGTLSEALLDAIGARHLIRRVKAGTLIEFLEISGRVPETLNKAAVEALLAKKKAEGPVQKEKDETTESDQTIAAVSESAPQKEQDLTTEPGQEVVAGKAPASVKDQHQPESEGD